VHILTHREHPSASIVNGDYYRIVNSDSHRSVNSFLVSCESLFTA
jgi:hypothetical protein